LRNSRYMRYFGWLKSKMIIKLLRWHNLDDKLGEIIISKCDKLTCFRQLIWLNYDILTLVFAPVYFNIRFSVKMILWTVSGRYRKHMRRNVNTCWLSIFRTSLQEYSSCFFLSWPPFLVNPRVAFNALPVCNFRHRVRLPVG